jgi:hypothetical protein
MRRRPSVVFSALCALLFFLDQFAIVCVGQFAKLSHDHRPIVAVCPVTQLQTDLSSAATQNQERESPLRFRITLSNKIAPKAASSRLFVLMTSAPQEKRTIEIGFMPGSTWVAATEVEHFAPGATIEFDPDLKAYPKPFSQARPGTYQVMALLDQNHTYAYHGEDEGDLTSAVVKIDNLNPAEARPIELTLIRSTPATFKSASDENIKLVEFQSPMLTKFWGRAIMMRAGVVLPPGYGKGSKKAYAGIYHVHGFGGNHTAAWRQGIQLVNEMSEGKSA